MTDAVGTNNHQPHTPWSSQQGYVRMRARLGSHVRKASCAPQAPFRKFRSKIVGGLSALDNVGLMKALRASLSCSSPYCAGGVIASPRPRHHDLVGCLDNLVVHVHIEVRAKVLPAIGRDVGPPSPRRQVTSLFFISLRTEHLNIRA